MGRRSGRVARLALRAGLVLGGVLCAWSAYDTLTVDAAYAADAPPAGVVVDVPGLLRTTLSPVLGAVTATSPPSDSPPPGAGVSPAGAGGTPATDTRSSHAAASTGGARPSAGPPGRPSGRRAGAGADRRAADPLRRGAQAPRPAGLGKPARSSTSPTGDGLPLVTGAAQVLSPVTEPIRARLVAPVAAIVAPVAAPLVGAVRPVLDPALAALSPVRDPLAPVLRPLDPVLAILQPVDPAPPPAEGPAGTPPAPQPAPPAGPPPTAAAPAAVPPTAARPVRTVGPDERSTPRVRNAGAGTATAAPGTAGRSAPRDAVPQQTPAPGPAAPPPGAGGTGSLHDGGPADATADTWSPGTGPGGPRRREPGAGLHSRSPRPGTRPA
ncbi:hypothetical protein ACFO0M_27980 [Micromonospora mangrovi]|uniref:Uncharacterized protein n=2 Tax=Micromonospora TaxID=1873 RepID=A0AAU8HME6_9ACTN